MKTNTNTNIEEKICPACGMTQDGWSFNSGRGVEFNGATYCCDGCASGTGCVCF